MNSCTVLTGAAGMSWSARTFSHSAAGFSAKRFSRIGSSASLFQTQHPRAEARVVRELLHAHGLAELGPERLIATGQEESFAVAGLVEAVGRVLADERGLARIVDGDARLQRHH